MSALSIFIAIFVTVTAVSYGWGMRGDLIGGEEGAMLPGAFLGLCLAWFSGIDIIRENFFIFAAVGAASMFMGGTEPYAQTLFKSYPDNSKRDMKTYFIGTSIKGAVWFAIAGGFLGMSFSASTGRFYRISDIIVLFVFIIIMRFFGVKIFNSPLDVRNGIYPKIYFSDTSPEEWGGLLLIVLTMLECMIYREDYFSIKMLFAGLLSGSIGWLIANRLNVITRSKMKNGKYFFGKWQENEKIDNWKIMEFSYGLLGSLGITLCFFANRDTLKLYDRILQSNGGIWNPLSSLSDKADVGFVLSLVWFALIILDGMHHLVNKPLYIGDLEEQYKAGTLLIYEYERLKKKASSKPVSKHYNRYVKLVQLCRRPLFSYSVLILCLLGAKQAAMIASFLLLFWTCIEELCFVTLDHHENAHKKIVIPVCLTLLALLTAGQFLLDGGYNIISTFVMYCVSYLAATMYDLFLSGRDKMAEYRKSHSGKLGITGVLDSLGSGVSVKGHYILCIVITTVLMCLSYSGII